MELLNLSNKRKLCKEIKARKKELKDELYSLTMKYWISGTHKGRVYSINLVDGYTSWKDTTTITLISNRLINSFTK